MSAPAPGVVIAVYSNHSVDYLNRPHSTVPRELLSPLMGCSQLFQPFRPGLGLSKRVILSGAEAETRAKRSRRISRSR